MIEESSRGDRELDIILLHVHDAKSNNISTLQLMQSTCELSQYI